MIWKLVALLGLALAIWSVVRRFLPPPPLSRGRRSAVEDLTRCRRCGAWGPAGEPCACRTPPVP